MYLKILLFSILEKFFMFIIETIFNVNSIIDELKTLIVDKTNFVDEFAKVIT